MKFASSTRAICFMAFINSIVFAPSVVNAKDFPELKNDTFTLNLSNADIVEYIKSVSRTLGQTFLVDHRVNAQISVYTEKPLNANEYYDFFVTTMQTYGYVVVEGEEVINIGVDQSNEVIGGRLVTPESTELQPIK